MATATAKPVVPTVLLELTGDEALTLIYICSNISGPPIGGRREHTTSIGLALRSALTPINGSFETPRTLSGDIHFGAENLA